MSSLNTKDLTTNNINHRKRPVSLAQLIILGLLTLVIAIGAIPGYLTGKWSWMDLPKVTRIGQLKNIQKTGITLPGWKTLEQKEIIIGGNQWSFQIIEKADQEPVTMLLMPQDYYRNHPQVEWVDLTGIEHWKTDSQQTLEFKTGNPTQSTVQARFFRAWKDKTFAVVQWYAWPKGGSFASSRWFWADQKAQLSRQREPWIAVSLKIPINPLSELKEAEAKARSLAQTVQATLEKDIFDNDPQG